MLESSSSPLSSSFSTLSPGVSTTSSIEQQMDWKIILIILLVIYILAPFFGINIQHLLQQAIHFLMTLLKPILAMFGIVINTTSTAASTVATTGIQAVDQSLHVVGNQLISPEKKELDQKIQEKPKMYPSYSPDSSDSVIQKKDSWCLVGQYQGVKGCVLVNDASKCSSGQLYPTQDACQK